MGRSRSAPTHHGPPGWCPSFVEGALSGGDRLSRIPIVIIVGSRADGADVNHLACGAWSLSCSSVLGSDSRLFLAEAEQELAPWCRPSNLPRLRLCVLAVGGGGVRNGMVSRDVGAVLSAGGDLSCRWGARGSHGLCWVGVVGSRGSGVGWVLGPTEFD